MSSAVMVYFEGSGLEPYPPDPDAADADLDYGEILALLGARLDALARSLGVRPLSDFHFADPEMLAAIASELDGRPRENVERVLASQRRWHSVADGRAAVASMLTYLEGLDAATAAERHPELLLGGTLAPLIIDLRALARTLSRRDARFHLESM